MRKENLPKGKQKNKDKNNTLKLSFPAFIRLISVNFPSVFMFQETDFLGV